MKRTFAALTALALVIPAYAAAQTETPVAPFGESIAHKHGDNLRDAGH